MSYSSVTPCTALFPTGREKLLLFKGRTAILRDSRDWNLSILTLYRYSSNHALCVQLCASKQSSLGYFVMQETTSYPLTNSHGSGWGDSKTSLYWKSLKTPCAVFISTEAHGIVLTFHLVCLSMGTRSQTKITEQKRPTPEWTCHTISRPIPSSLRKLLPPFN